ncbi:MAG: hypothetical protein HYY04_01250 [Chloroflexi bacterium]|nr:hypothetical protein [Chloroflexota bacterium]
MAILGGVFLASGGLLDVVNPATILHTRSDVAALEWIRDHVPGDSRFLVNALSWQGDLYAGADGGFWIPVIARREVTTPPLVYHGAQPTAVAAVRDVSAAVSAWSGDRASLDRLIREQRITHIYVGARHGSLRPSFFLENGYPVLFSDGRAWVFAAR